MSTESSSNSSSSEFGYLTAFPISEKAITGTLAWLSYFSTRSDENLKMEEAHLKDIDPNLSVYFAEMAYLRGQLHLTDENLDRYKQGAMFGFNLLTSQFDSVGLMLPSANKPAFDTYFKSLISNPNAWRHIDPQYSTLVSIQPGIVKGPITQSVLTQMFRSNPSDAFLIRVKKTFEDNTNDQLKRMWSAELPLATAVPAINNVIDNGQRGFYIGLMDAYWPFNMDHIVGPYVDVMEQKLASYEEKK